LAAEGIMPLRVLLAIMRWHYRARRYDAAERVASLAAPFVHARLRPATVAVAPSLQEMLLRATDAELAVFAEQADHLADLAEGGLGKVKPRGSV
jgi:hypothetical protein